MSWRTWTRWFLGAVARWQSVGLPVVMVTVARTWISSPRPPGEARFVDTLRMTTTGKIGHKALREQAVAQAVGGSL